MRVRVRVVKKITVNIFDTYTYYLYLRLSALKLECIRYSLLGQPNILRLLAGYRSMVYAAVICHCTLHY